MREYEYNPEIMRLTVMGGGACILKHFWDGNNNRVQYIDDICATAKGYCKHYRYRTVKNPFLIQDPPAFSPSLRLIFLLFFAIRKYIVKPKIVHGIYEKFNLHRPLDFLGHSLSVSDVIVTNRSGQEQAFYVDSFGFKEVPEFFAYKEQEKAFEQFTDRTKTREAEGSQRKSVLSRLQEKKDEAARINRQRQKPEKVKGIDHGIDRECSIEKVSSSPEQGNWK